MPRSKKYEFKASVLIPVYNDWKGLTACLEGLAAQTLPKTQWELLIADNGSDTPPPPGLKRRLKNARWIQVARPGAAVARNKLARLCRGEIMIHTDADAIHDPNWLKETVAAYAADPSLTVGGCRVLLFSEQDPPCLPDLYQITTYLDVEHYIRRSRMICTCALSLRASEWKAIGEFPETHYSGYDHSWSALAIRAGHELRYLPRPLIHHPTRPCWASWVGLTRRIAGGQVVRAIAAKRFGKTLLKAAAVLPFCPWFSYKKIRPARRRLERPLKPAELAALFLLEPVRRLILIAEMTRIRLGGVPNRS